MCPILVEWFKGKLLAGYGIWLPNWDLINYKPIVISFHFIIQKELESSEDVCEGSDMITSTNDSKSGQMIKRFKDLEVDEIIESFDVSDSVLNDLESSSNDQARPSRQHTLMTNGQKPRLSKNLKRKSKNSKQGRSQVLPFFYISGILVVLFVEYLMVRKM